MAKIQPAEMPTEMGAIRERIDALDSQIVALLRQRLAQVERAGEVKTERAQVIDEERIETIIARVKTLAVAQNVPPEFAEQVWRLIIKLSIEHEFKIFDD